MLKMLGRLLRKLFKAVAVLAAVGLLVVVLFVASLWVEHTLSVELPLPTGPFAVGRVSATWVDTSREDPFAPRPAEDRELAVWIWYPAQRSDGTPTAEYLSGPVRSRLAEIRGVVLNHFILRHPEKVHVHSTENAELAPAEQTYPVVIFNSGIGVLALEYSTLAEDLASRGYIVVGTDRPYSTSVVVMRDGRLIRPTAEGNPGDGRMPADQLDRVMKTLLGVWTADTGFVLDQLARMNENDASGQFTGRINLSSVGVAGHSFGGATAAQFCQDDDRCIAGIDIDGAFFVSVEPEGMRKPFLFLLADYGSTAVNSSDSEFAAEIRAAVAPDPDNKLIVIVLGAHHFSFGDQALTQSRIFRSLLARISGLGGVKPRTGLAITRRYVSGFFDVHLRGAPSDTLYARPLVDGAQFLVWTDTL